MMNYWTLTRRNLSHIVKAHNLNVAWQETSARTQLLFATITVMQYDL